MEPYRLLLASLAMMLVTVAPTEAGDARMLEKYNVGGFIGVPGPAPYIFFPHPNPRSLPRAGKADLSRRGNIRAVRDARSYMKRFPATTGMMLIERGKIVFEAYQGLGNRRSEFFGMSISKSLTGLAVGKALCDGHIAGLETVAGDIVPELKVNNHGRSTIRQLLTMSSGAYMSHIAGQPKFKGGLGRRPRGGEPFAVAPWPLRLGQVSLSDLLWGAAWDKVENKNPSAPGEAFVYMAGDTMSLGKAVERATGMSLAAYFDRSVWLEVRSAAKDHWEQDTDGSTIAMSGFQASLADWGRIATWVIEERRKRGCFGDYLRAATTTQIPNERLGSAAGGGFDGYGYQWWTDHRTVPGFWGKGHAGQELGINPKTGKILIKFGYRTYQGVTSELNKLFRNWNKAR